MITRDGRAKVLDFGLAKLMEPEPTDATMTGVGTRPGIILGTAAYMSPEQAQGHPVDSRSDLFSFGAVLYEMLTGRRPFAGDSEIGLITAILRDQPPPLKAARADVPAALQSIVDRCLAKDPGARFPRRAVIEGRARRSAGQPEPPARHALAPERRRTDCTPRARRSGRRWLADRAGTARAVGAAADPGNRAPGPDRGRRRRGSPGARGRAICAR